MATEVLKSERATGIEGRGPSAPSASSDASVSKALGNSLASSLGLRLPKAPPVKHVAHIVRVSLGQNRPIGNVTPTFGLPSGI